MKVENICEVPAPKRLAWNLLMDVPRVVPCLPGAELTETLGENRWKADMKVKFGPISLVFDTLVTREQADEGAGFVRLQADAREKRGRGGARAQIDTIVTGDESETRLQMVTDLALSGTVAQYGRGIVQDVAQQLTAKFAENLRTEISSGAGTPDAGEAPRASKPISGLSIGARAVWHLVLAAFGRLFRLLHLRRREAAD